MTERVQVFRTPHGKRLRDLVTLRRRPSAVLLGTHLMYRAMMAGWWILLARLFAPESVGVMALANAVAIPVFVALDAGVSQMLVREFTPGVGFPDDVRQVLRRRYVFAGGGVVGAVAIAWVVTRSETAAAVTAAIAAGYAVDFLTQMWLSPDRAMLDNRPEAGVKAVQGTGAIAFVLIAVWTGMGIIGAAVAVLISYVLASVLPLVRWRARVRFQSRSSQTSGTDRRVFVAAAVLVALYTRVDSLAIQISEGAGALAIYTVAFKLIESSRLPGWALGRTALAAASLGRPPAPSKMLGGVTLGVGVAAFVFCAGPALQQFLFGSEYGGDEAAVTLRVLSLSLAFSAFTAQAHGAMLGSGGERLVLRAAVVVAAVTVALMTVLTPLWGLIGTASAVLVAELANGALFWWYWRSGRARLGFGKADGAATLFAVACCLAALLLPVIAVVAGSLAALFAAAVAARSFQWV